MANKDFNPPLGRLFSATILWWALFAGYDPKCSLLASGPPLILISCLATEVGSVHYSSWDALGFFSLRLLAGLSVCLCRRCACICSLALQLVDARRADSRPDTHAARCFGFGTLLRISYPRLPKNKQSFRFQSSPSARQCCARTATVGNSYVLNEHCFAY